MYYYRQSSTFLGKESFMGETKEKQTAICTPQDYYNRTNVLCRANTLVSAKYKANLNDLKLTFMGMLYLQQNKYHDDKDGLRVDIPVADIKRFLGVKSNSIYESLNASAKSMNANTVIGYSDPQRQVFDYMALITRARYENCTLQIWFGKSAIEYLANDKTGFTKIEKKYAVAFRSAYAFRLYEIIRKNCYYPKGYQGPRNGVFSYSISLSELKLEMGVVNANFDSVRRILQEGGANPDYDEAVRVYDEAIKRSPEKIKSYNIWNNFKNRCLDPAVNEINDICEMYVEYKPIRSGRGGKINGITFTAYLNGKDVEVHPPVMLEQGEIKPSLSDEDKFIIIVNTLSLFPNCDLQYPDIQAICEAANYDETVIKNAAEAVTGYRGNIENVVGFAINAIKNPIEKKSLKKEPLKKVKKSSFHDFDDRPIDFEEIERKLLQE